MTTARQAVIGTVRVRTRDPDGDGASRRVAAGLSAVRLDPPGLAPAAVLVVRRLADPVPRLFDRDRLGPVAPRWEVALRAELARVAAEAARPGDGAVPAGARAVLFTDRADVLACLASDWLAGTLGSRWWWRWLVRPGHHPDPVTRVWVEYGGWIPAALDLLADRGAAVAFARRLTPVAIDAVLDAVVIAFGIAGRGPPAGAAAAPRPAGAEPAAATAPPWQERVPEAGTGGLSPQERMLLAVGLLLRRAPALARQPSFLPAARAWAASAGPAVRPARITSGHVPRPVRRREPDRMPDTARLDEGGDPVARPPGPRRTGSRTVDTPTGRMGAVDGGRDRGEPTGHARARLELSKHRLQPDGAGWMRASGHRPDPGAPAMRRNVTAPDPGTGPAPPSAQLVRTRLGGLFYLLNLGRHLDLYGDATTPSTPDIPLDVWDFVTLLGRRLLETPAPADPIWDLLAALAGRDRTTPPGRLFTPPAEWRVPVRWLAAVRQDGPWRWSAAAGRLRVEHPADFPVLDVPRTDETARNQLGREFDAIAAPTGATPRRCLLPSLPTRPVARWIACLGAYARARLASALDRLPAQAVDLLLWHDATVTVTHVHVDVALSLATLPIEIRLCGLDRDPGWIPAAGQFMAFHFD